MTMPSPGAASALAWRHNYADIVPDWFEAYLGLEPAALGISAYEIQFIPSPRMRSSPLRSRSMVRS